MTSNISRTSKIWKRKWEENYLKRESNSDSYNYTLFILLIFPYFYMSVFFFLNISALFFYSFYLLRNQTKSILFFLATSLDNFYFLFSHHFLLLLHSSFSSFFLLFYFPRNQTKGLLRLILALDSPLTSDALILKNNTVIVSGKK